MFPIFLNLAERLCLVVGGGSVGRRKAAHLLDSGALVRLICLEACPAELVSSRLDWRTEPYSSAHVTGASLVIAAATPEINRQVVADARRQGIWVNTATEPAFGDFYVPANLRRGDFIVAVGTGGAAPVLAQEVCRRLDPQFDLAFADWVALLTALRPLILATVTDKDHRRQLFRQLAEWRWLERLRRDGAEAVREAMLAEVLGLSENSANPL